MKLITICLKLHIRQIKKPLGYVKCGLLILVLLNTKTLKPGIGLRFGNNFPTLHVNFFVTNDFRLILFTVRVKS